MHNAVLSSRGDAYTVRRKLRQSRFKGEKGCFELFVSSKLTLSNAIARVFVFFCNTKVELHQTKTEICLFTPFKAKITLHPTQIISGLFNFWVSPPTRGIKLAHGWFSEVFLQSTHEFLKNKKKINALNVFVNVPMEPLLATSRHKAGVMASHRLYAELFWRFTQSTSATVSVRTYTPPRFNDQSYGHICICGVIRSN